MARRIASPWWLRAEGARVPWATIIRRRLQTDREGPVDPRVLAAQMAVVGRRPVELHLRWACSELLGVPFGPFTVWIRAARDETKGVDARTRARPGGIRLSWGFVAAVVEVECTVIDPARPVALFATRGGGSLHEAVGATAVRAAAGARVTLRVRCSGATRVVLVNGSAPVVRCQALDEVINDPAWKPLERVGLPVDNPWPATAYDTGRQGLVAAPTDPVTAALQRLQRGGPPIGWYALTEMGRVAPPWTPPDHVRLLQEIRRDVLPRIERLYRAGIVPPDQGAVVDSPPVDPPHHGGHPSSLSAKVQLPPLALLTLPASSNPFLALATGFGTAYPANQQLEQVPFGRADFLVTAEYQETPLRQGRATVAAFVPLPGEHGDTVSPTTLTAERAGLVSPEQRDGPWRETVRVSWNRSQASAALGRPSGAILARYDTTGVPLAECLLPLREAGDFRPLLMVPDGPPGTPNFARTAMVDAAAVIPLGSGGRTPAYAAAVEDVFGVWSRWEDVPYAGTEPAPPTPRVLAVSLTTSYAGTTTCPTILEVELSVDWADRTPVRVELASVFFHMADAKALPPAGTAPVGPAPAGGFRRDLVFPFVGDELRGPTGATIEHLDTAGENSVTPGPLQGDQGRRYRVRVPVPTLDFAPTRRWGVQLWLRGRLAVLPGDTSWSPDASHPALASAASPVPVAPLPPPIPPGVPMGSTPDAQGCSHVRLRWSLPAGADVQKVVVWEVAESALRQMAGLTQRDPEGTLPGWRLQHLRDAYDAMPTTRRRAAFRRLLELPGSARETDVALPKGSTDIHLFTVTTVTSTSVESPWPDGAAPHEHLQAVMAPRIRRPAAPRLRALVGVSGPATLSLEAPSRISVQEFRLFRTRSAEAARNVETMGPAFAVVPAVAPPPGSTPDPVTGERTWSAEWSGVFDASWDDWFIRATAVPVDSVPEEAVRGTPSPPCDPVTLSALPDAPPDLAPLIADVWGDAHDGVLVRTSTSAPMRALALGSHRVSGIAGSSIVAPIPVEDIRAGPTLPSDAPPAGATAAPVLVHAARAAGRTPLALWFRRPTATDPVNVVLRLADPLGRVTERALTVPGWVPPPPVLPTLRLLDVFKIIGRGAVLHLRSDAPVDVAPPYVLRITATPRILPRGLPFPPMPGGFPPLVRPRPVIAAFPLDAIPHGTGPFGTTATIQAVRISVASPHSYQVLVRLQPPFTVTAAMVAPGGAQTQVSTEVR